MTERKKGIRFGFLIAAAFFLFNPNINILDVLPDCFAYLLLYYGLSGTEFLVPHFEDARRWFLRLFWLTLSRIPAFFLMSSMTHGDSSLGVTTTLFALVYGICELLCLFPAIRTFYAGMEYLAERHGAFAFAGPRMKQARHYTYLALVAKPILAFLPELCYLTLQDPLFVSGAIDYVYFRPHLIVLACLIGLVLGILFLVAFLRYCRQAAGDPSSAEILRRLQSQTEAPARGADVQRRIRLATLFLTLGALSCLDLIFDRINYLPDAIGALLFLCAALLLYPVTGKPALWAAAGAALWFLCSVPAYWFRQSFFSRYTYESLGFSPTADSLYENSILFAALEFFAATLACAAMAVLLFRIINTCTGHPGDEIHAHGRLPLHRMLHRKTVVFAVLGSLCSFLAFLDLWLGQFTVRLAHGLPTEDGIANDPDGVVLPFFSSMWLICWIACAIFFLYTRHLSSVLNEEVACKYKWD